VTLQGKTPVPSPAASINFLKRFSPDGPWVLSSIAPNGKGIETCTFDPVQDKQAYEWIQKYNGVRNLYFMVNPVIKAVSKKAKREDVLELAWLHVDIDARRGETGEQAAKRGLKSLQACPGSVPMPTCIVFSGGGVQAFWRLDGPLPINGEVEAYEDAKRYNQQLEAEFDGDNCHNVDRIMRLPGTINIPNEKKRKKGRVEVLAEVIEFHDYVYPLGKFVQASAQKDTLQDNLKSPMPKQNVCGKIERLGSVDELPDTVPDKCKMIIVQGEDPDDPDRWPSDSECCFSVICELLRHKTPDNMILSVITDPDFQISRHVLKQANWKKYADRQIERAKQFADATDFHRNGAERIVADSQHNIRLALAKLGVELRHDLFADREIVQGLPGFGPAIDDAAANRLWLLIDERFKFRPGKDFFHTVLGDQSRQNRFHPIKDYLESLEWDGKPRIGGWLTTYGGAEDTPYCRAVGTLFLIAAVRRVMKPGVKFDQMLVLESDQGTNKSTALKMLAVKSEWFTDDLPLNADTRRVIEALSGKWIVEAGELKGMKSRGGGVAHLKSFLSRTHDKARMAYDRREREVPRQSIIVGTTNDNAYLRDQTGNRRFWPVRVTVFDLDKLQHDRDQLWAEAVAREAEGAIIQLDPNLWDRAAEQQNLRAVEDPFYESLHDVLGLVKTGKIKASDCWLILGRKKAEAQDENERLGQAMKRLGFTHTKRRFNGSDPMFAYVRGTGAATGQWIQIRCNEHGQFVEVNPEQGEVPF
jgi:predicted P-loop ATPase